MKINKNKKAVMIKFRHHLVIPLLVVLLAIPLVAQAAGSGTTFDDAVKAVFSFFSLILTAIQAVLWPILLLIGNLLNNDLLFSGGMQTMLLNIWTAIRDFVNILFVLGLLFVAVYNILGFAPDDYSIPKILPKIAIGLIAVNFSFLMCKVVLDVVNVTTTAIFAVPMASNALVKYKDPLNQGVLEKNFCNKVMKSTSEVSQQSIDEMKKSNPYCELKDKNNTSAGYKLTQFGIDFFSSFNSRNAAMVMAFELMQITSIDDVDTKAVGDTKTLAINSIFSLIFLVIYGTSYIALFVVMLVRVIILWISIALMPLSFLGMSFGKVKSALGDKDPMKLFFSHALIPINVSVVLTIGMIMITQLKQIVPDITYSTTPQTLGAITSNMSTLQSIMAGLATAAFIWIAAFTAMKGTMADGVVNKIKGTVQGFGENIIKLPLYAPIIPTKQGKVGVGMLGAGLAGGGALGKFVREKQAEYESMAGNKGGYLANKLKESTTANEARENMGNLISGTPNYRVDAAGQKAIAEQLGKYQELMRMKAPGVAGLNTMAAFKEALANGKLKTPEEVETVMRAFMEKNKDVFTSVENQKTEAVSSAKEVAGGLNDSGKTVLPGMQEAANKLNTAADKLNTNYNVKDATELRTQVANDKKVVAARDSFDANLTEERLRSSLNADGTAKDQASATTMQNTAKNFRDALTDKDKPEMEKVLAKRIMGAVGVDESTANTIARNIINGTMRVGAPAAGATPATAAANPSPNTSPAAPPGNPPSTSSGTANPGIPAAPPSSTGGTAPVPPAAPASGPGVSAPGVGPGTPPVSP
jgi:hypothetical protein